MDRFRFPKEKKKVFLSADDVPPTEPCKSPVKTRGPMRKYYYEMHDLSVLPGVTDKMAAPVDNVRQGKFQTGTFQDMKKDTKIVETLKSISDGKKPMPHCKACTDFKTWMELTANPRRDMSRVEREEKECPLDSELLGRNTWSFLHTMAAYYPEKPTFEQQHNMKSFITLLSQFYPCHICAAHLRDDLKTNQPDTSNNQRLSQWFCKLHNKVNIRLGKPAFDCSKVMERWRDGWADHSCD